MEHGVLRGREGGERFSPERGEKHARCGNHSHMFSLISVALYLCTGCTRWGGWLLRVPSRPPCSSVAVCGVLMLGEVGPASIVRCCAVGPTRGQFGLRPHRYLRANKLPWHAHEGLLTATSTARAAESMTRHDA